MSKVLVFICIISLGGLSNLIWPRAQKAQKSATDAAIQSDLEFRLSPFSRFREEPLRVFAGNGVVRLEGKTLSQYDHDAVLQIVQQGAGTNKIVDGLTVAASDVGVEGQKDRYAAWLSRRRPSTVVNISSNRVKSDSAAKSN